MKYLITMDGMFLNHYMASSKELPVWDCQRARLFDSKEAAEAVLQMVNARYIRDRARIVEIEEGEVLK